MLAACAGAPPATPAVPVEQDYPALQGRIVRTAELAAPEPLPVAYEQAFTADPAQVVRPPCTIRLAMSEAEERTYSTYDGRIDLPRIGEVRMAGRTIESVRDELLRRLGQWVRDPVVDLQVLVTRRPERARIGVDVAGWVPRPSRQELLEGVTARVAIAQAGGVLDGAELDEVLVIRGSQVYWCDWMADADRADIALRDGDVIYVPSPRPADVPYGPMWAPVAAHLGGSISREELLARLNAIR